jgi:hypothetical protein
MAYVPSGLAPGLYQVGSAMGQSQGDFETFAVYNSDPRAAVSYTNQTRVEITGDTPPRAIISIETDATNDETQALAVDVGASTISGVDEAGYLVRFPKAIIFARPGVNGAKETVFCVEDEYDTLSDTHLYLTVRHLA